MVHSQRGYNFPDLTFPTLFGKIPAKNLSHKCHSPTQFGDYLLLPNEDSKMYNILNDMELYFTAFLITMLAITVPWC